VRKIRIDPGDRSSRVEKGKGGWERNQEGVARELNKYGKETCHRIQDRESTEEGSRRQIW
jgi:hypothetical protein